MQKQGGVRLVFWLVSAVALGVSGCGHRVSPMGIASNAGTRAVAEYDANKDGSLDYDELAKAPGLRAAVAKIKNLIKRRGEVPEESELQSVKITAAEIDARIQQWKSLGTGRVKVLCHVYRVEGGKAEPLEGAQVKFLPEDFLGTDLTVGVGTTDESGTALVSQPSRGTGNPAHGMSPGFYRVEITREGDSIPAKYNTATTLGQEVAVDAAGISSGGPVFALEY